MLRIEFEGFFEARLATDNDHFEEKRGTDLGWTFATPDEPDLDRIVRFQPGLAVQRRPGVDVGVVVTGVFVDDAEVDDHPLLGALVDLKDNPVFEGRNGQIAGSTEEPIFPFHIAIEGSGIRLAREMRDSSTGKPALVKAVGDSFSPALFAETGITDPTAYRDARLQAIRDRLAIEADPLVRQGLEWRRMNIEDAAGSPSLMWGPVPAQVFVNYVYTLAHPNGVVDDPNGHLPRLDLEADWRFQCGLGAWDADVLSGFAVGRLIVPLLGGPSA